MNCTYEMWLWRVFISGMGVSHAMIPVHVDVFYTNFRERPNIDLLKAIFWSALFAEWATIVILANMQNSIWNILKGFRMTIFIVEAACEKRHRAKMIVLKYFFLQEESKRRPNICCRNMLDYCHGYNTHRISKRENNQVGSPSCNRDPGA